MSATLFRNPLYEGLLSQRRDAARRRFDTLRGVATDDILSFFGYLERQPEKFYSRDIANLASARLADIDASARADLDDYLTANQESLNSAFRFLAEINRQRWHDDLEGEHAYDEALLIDRDLHPAYLRLTEGVFTPLTRLFAHFSRRDRGAGTGNLNPYAIEQELAGGVLCALTRSYNRTVRNALAHGGVEYVNNEFRLSDRHATETLAAHQVVSLVDDLVDDCNGLALAYRLFFLTTNRPPPRQHVVEELQAVTDAPWWRVEGCLASKTGNDENQLDIYVRVATTDAFKVQYSALQTAVVAERLLPGSDRYFVSLRGPAALPGFAALDGIALRDLRTRGCTSIEEYAGVVQQLFFVPTRQHPRAVHRVNSFLLAAKAYVEGHRESARFSDGSKHISVRHVKAHRNGWGLVVNAHVVIGDGYSTMTRDVVKHRPGAIIRTAVTEARQRILNDWEGRLPVAFAQVAVLQRDYRRRRLRNFGLADDLVCTVRLHRMSRIRSPDIMGSEVEMIGGYRVAWNRLWLEMHPPDITRHDEGA